MTAPQLAHVETLSRDWAQSIKAAVPSREATWHAFGDVGTGKSRLLTALAAQWRGGGDLHPVVVAPPPGEIDAGGVALVQIGEQLRAAGLIGGEIAALADPQRQWRDKLADVQGWLRSHQDHMVVLCDEPGRWPASSAEHKHFQDHARDVQRLLFEDLACRRVVVGTLPDGVHAAQSQRLRPSPVTGDWIAAEWSGHATAGAAARVADMAGLERHSPLEIRLLVALREVADAGEFSQAARLRGAYSLAQALLGTLTGRPDFAPLLDMWKSVSLIRRPVEADLLARLGADRLPPRQRDLLTLSLMYGEGDRFVMHSALRAAINDFQVSHSRLNAMHRAIAEYYRACFSARRDDTAMLVEEMEAYHHASEAADPALFGAFREFFVDQLDARGRALSQRGRYDEAASIFRRALTWDDGDDYAHHYYAYNLDVQGLEPATVDASYRRALELDPTNIWWWSRYICFLITVGRRQDARQAWEGALEQFAWGAASQGAYLYLHLHGWVARLLLHRGLLDFAEEVLNQIPQAVKDDDAKLRALERHLRVLRAAEEGRIVYPLDVPPEDWFGAPRLSPEYRTGGGDLREWMPGRIDAVDDGEVLLSVAVLPQTADGEPEFGYLSFSRAEFDAFLVDAVAARIAPGRFVEIAYYAEATDPEIRLHPDRPWVDKDLPPVGPDPVRYLRRKGLVRTDPVR